MPESQAVAQNWKTSQSYPYRILDPYRYDVWTKGPWTQSTVCQECGSLFHALDERAVLCRPCLATKARRLDEEEGCGWGDWGLYPRRRRDDERSPISRPKPEKGPVKKKPVKKAPPKAKKPTPKKKERPTAWDKILDDEIIDPQLRV
jgi:hypothetical protein